MGLIMNNQKEELKEAYEGLKVKHRRLEAKHEELKKQLAAAAWENQALLEAHNAEYREKREFSKLVQILLKDWESERKEYNYKSK
jgi:hypothetical protein